jgi:hypothetical protein
VCQSPVFDHVKHCIPDAGEFTHVGRLAMELKEFGHIKLRRLNDLCLANIDVLQRVDASGRLLDFPPNRLRDELLNQLLQVTTRCLARHDLEHLLPDFADLRGLRVGGLLHLRRPTLGETNGEEAEDVTVGRLHIDVRFDQRLPFPDEGAELVRGKVHAVEVGKAVLALDFVNAQFDFAEGLLLVLVEVTEGKLDDAALERIIGVLYRGIL